MSKSTTPRTDASAIACYDNGRPDFVYAGFARQLETELSAALAKIYRYDKASEALLGRSFCRNRTNAECSIYELRCYECRREWFKNEVGS